MATRVARGIFKDQYGYEIRWREAGRTRTKRFPPDTPLDTLKAKRQTYATQGLTVQPGVRDGSFPRDVAKYLRSRQGLVSYASDRSHFKPWITRFRRLSRWSITPDMIRAALAEWRSEGKSARTLRHRLRVLKGLYQQYDGSARLLDGIPMPVPPKPRPVSVSDATVKAVAESLQRQEQKGVGRLRDSKTRARYLVLATTGQRPAQVMRAQKSDIDRERRIWFVRPAKGDNGGIVYLNEDMLAAWNLFFRANAWGVFDSRSFSKTLKRNGWPQDIRPYNLRHSVGLSMSEHSVELGDIQAHMGHANVNTTRQFYVPVVLARLKAASTVIDGRIGLAATTPTTTFPNLENAPIEEIGPKTASRKRRWKTRLYHAKEGNTG